MQNGLTLPPIVTTAPSGGITIDTGFSWGTYATADWQGAGEAIITTDGMTYSLPLADGPIISSADMEMFHDWLEMKSGIKAFTYELKMAERSINNNDALGAIKDLWKITEADNYLLNNGTFVTHAYFKNKLVNFSLADALVAQQNASNQEALIRASTGHGTVYELITPELSGGTFTPIKAFSHYLWGNGQ